jgi:ribosome-associated protein
MMKKRGVNRGAKRRAVEPVPEEKSRSQIKRDSIALQKMGEEMAQLPPRLIMRLGISEEVTEAILGIKPLGPGKVRRRQIQFVGKLLRSMDEDSLENLKKNYRRLQRLGSTPDEVS